MKNEYKIKSFERRIIELTYALETLKTADLDEGDLVLYQDQNYYISEVNPKYNGVCGYDLTKPKKNGGIPSRAIDPVYSVERHKLTKIFE